MLDESERLGAMAAGKDASGMRCDTGTLSSSLCTLREMSARVALRAGSRTSMHRSSFSMPGRWATAAILSAGMTS